MTARHALIGLGVLAVWFAAGIGVVWCVGKAVHRDDRWTDDEWQRAVAESAVRIPTICDDCGNWFESGELTRGRCTECRFRAAVAALLDENDGAA